MSIRRIVLGWLLCLAVEITYAAEHPSPEALTTDTSGSPAENSPGAQLAAELTARYNATPSHCEDDSPAYRCSGVIVRGTRQKLPEGQNAWEPYPRGRVLDSSFTFLRADLKATRLAWNYSNGFIIAPPDELSVNCFFPVDAVSDDRQDQGCGADRTRTRGYSFCQALLADHPVQDRDSEEYQWTLGKLADLWLAWDQEHAADVRRRCSYSLKDAHATQRFELALAVAAKTSQTTDKPNDMKIQTWNPGHDPRLPIRAFFYVNDQGKPFALRDREAFEKTTSIRLPVLRLAFSGGAPATVLFIHEEQ